MYVRDLRATNFRCFENLDVQFLHPADDTPVPARLPNVNLILGTNAAGKSAVLKALVIGVLNESLNQSGFVSNYLVRKTTGTQYRAVQNFGLKDRVVQPGDITTEAEMVPQCDIQSFVAAGVMEKIADDPITQATVEIDLTVDAQDSINSGLQNTTLVGNATLVRKGDTEVFVPSAHSSDPAWSPIFENDHPAFFLAAYGATRRVDPGGDIDLTSRDRYRKPRYQRVAGLFEDYVALVPPATWVRQLASINRLDEATLTLDELLPSEVRVARNTAKSLGDLQFSVHSTILPFLALSDGYRAFIGWVGDLIFNLALVAERASYKSIKEVSGVVIVDEIDLHLHPEWQLTVADSIAKAFPKLQFFFTSHSPLVTGSLESSNIFVAGIDQDGKRHLTKGKEMVHGLSADQILTGAYFGLTAPRSPDANDELKQIALRAWQGDGDASIEYLRKLATGFESVESKKFGPSL